MVDTVLTFSRFRRFNSKILSYGAIFLFLYTLSYATDVDTNDFDENDDILNIEEEFQSELPQELLSDDKRFNFYVYEVTDIRGNPVKLSIYKGKVTLVVNVASQCGYTDGHYKELVKLQDELGKTGKFTILAFPCNQFGAQEPKSNEEIEKFVTEKYKVNFPMFAKINVLDEDIPEAWNYLRDKSQNIPNWNFWKYLVDENGYVLNSWGPWVSVNDIYSEVKLAVDKIVDTKDNGHSEL